MSPQFHCLAHTSARTRNERADVNTEQNLGAFEYYDGARHLCIIAIALSYSSLVPLILPVALMYFVIWYELMSAAAFVQCPRYCVDKYNMLVIIRKNKNVYDMQGRLARYYYSYLLYALCIYHMVMLSIFAIQYALVEVITRISLSFFFTFRLS